MLSRGLLLCCMLGVACSSTPGVRVTKGYNKMKLKPGVEVLLLQDKRLPLVSVMMLLGVGSRHDGPLRGLSDFTGEMLMLGTGTQSATEWARDLDRLGAYMSVSTGADYTVLKAGALSQHWPQFFKSYFDAFLNPAFQPQEFKRYKKKLLASLLKTADKPGALASEVINEYVYAGGSYAAALSGASGSGSRTGPHPYAHHEAGKIASIKKLRLQDVKQHYKARYTQGPLRLAVVGDFEKAPMLKALRQYLGAWRAEPLKVERPLEFRPVQKQSLMLLHKPKLAQAQLRFAHEGIARSNKDYIALKVVNTILGGTFNSRLMQEVRVKKGLTYSISSYFMPHRYDGPFVISTFTRNDKVAEAIATVLESLKLFHSRGLTEDELRGAKNYLRGFHPRLLETKPAVAGVLLSLDFFGISPSYLDTFFSKVEKLGVRELNRVIKKYIHPDRLKILVHADRAQVLKQMQQFGPVEQVHYKKVL